MNPGERGDLRWRVGSVLWCDGVDRPGAHGVNSLSGLRGYGEKQLTMTPGDLALNLESGRDERQNQPQRNERTQRSVQVNILSSCLCVVVVRKRSN